MNPSKMLKTTIGLFILVNAFTIQTVNATGRFDKSTGTFKCSNGMPEFTGARPYGYSNSQARRPVPVSNQNMLSLAGKKMFGERSNVVTRAIGEQGH